MKNLLFFLSCLLSVSVFCATEEETATDTTASLESDTSLAAFLDSMHLQMLNYDTTGTIVLGTGIAKLNIPVGFKYLNPEQSNYVLSTLWGNPPGETYGMIFPSEAGSFMPGTWAIEITYEEDGHVKDDDAKDIDYDDLLEDMQKSMKEGNEARKAEGYPEIELLGWASPPYYDESEKKLHWAKRLRFEGDSLETLNYNIRVLGRKGVLVLNAIGRMEELDEIKSKVDPILTSVNFTDGNGYADFDESMDNVAAYGIGGLIAGGVLAKTGVLAKIGLLLAKFSKVIIVGVIAAGGAIARFFTGKGKQA